MLNIAPLLADLAKQRKLFHSEADFQHALAWQIHKILPDNGPIRLEAPMPAADRTLHVDIWLPLEKTAIELKYATRSLALEHDREAFTLRDHRAQNQRRYDFLRDIERLEFMRRSMPDLCEAGHAVLLTNDPSYWNPSRRPAPSDSAFRLHEGREISRQMTWTDKAGEGMKKGRKSPIRLEGSYRLRWQDYSVFPGETRGLFRYLAVSVT